MTAEETPPAAGTGPGGSGEPPPDAPEQAHASRRPGRAVWVVAGAAATLGLLLVPSLFSGAFISQSRHAAQTGGGTVGDQLVAPDPVNAPDRIVPPSGAPSIGAQVGAEPPPSPARTGSSGAPASHQAAPQHPATGAGTQRSDPAVRRPAPPPAPSQAPAPPRPAATYRATGGEDCPQTSSQGYYRIGTYSDGTAGWYRRNGGWARNGCRGTFMAVPMSGNRSVDDPAAYAVWWFRTGAVRGGTCAVSVYVPNSGTARDVAGHPAVYQVVRGEYDMRLVRSFTVDQTAHRGHWVGVGSYPANNGQFALRLVNRGEDPHGEHLAAAQVQVSCTAG